MLSSILTPFACPRVASETEDAGLCLTCNGSGVCHFNRSRNNDPQCWDDEPCRACDGTGERR